MLWVPGAARCPVRPLVTAAIRSAERYARGDKLPGAQNVSFEP
jgi:hypothetical protein